MCWIRWVTLDQYTLSTDNLTPMNTVVLGKLAATRLFKNYYTILGKANLTVMLTLTRLPMGPILSHLYQPTLHSLTI